MPFREIMHFSFYFDINQEPTSNGGTCYCEQFLHRCEQQMDRNKKEVLKHLSNTHGRLANRITSLEKKTKDQISYLSNSMKETIAQVNEINIFHIFCILFDVLRKLQVR